MSPDPKPQSLADLLGYAEHYAEFNLRYRGSLTGTLFLLGPKGPAAFVDDDKGWLELLDHVDHSAHDLHCVVASVALDR